MRTSKLFIIVAVLAIFAMACKKDAKPSETNLVAPPNASVFKEIRENILSNITTTKTFSAANGINFTTSKGTQVLFSPNIVIDQNNQTYQGNISFSIVDIYDRGTMVVANKPLMGKDNDGNLMPLITGGQFFTKIQSASEVANLSFGNFYTVKLPVVNTGGVDVGMKSWNGYIDTDGNLEWEENMPWSHEVIFATPDLNVGTYDISLSNFGWFNIDKFYAYMGNTTKIKVKVPVEYNKQNSSVYVAFSEEPEVLAQLGEYNNIEASFTENYGFSPIGMKVYVIFVTESNGGLAYALKTTTVTANQVMTIERDNIKPITTENLIALINQLN